MPTILVYWSEGRSQDQKSQVIDGIVDVMVGHGGARREDVVVILQDVEKGSITRGGAHAKPTPPSPAEALD